MSFSLLSVVVISGSNLFGHAVNVSEVTFGGIQADIDYTQATDTEITVRIQSNAVTSDTAVSVVITGSTLARVSSSGNDWTYLVPGRIGNVQPNIGQNGTMVTITGKIFASIYCPFGWHLGVPQSNNNVTSNITWEFGSLLASGVSVNGRNF